MGTKGQLRKTSPGSKVEELLDMSVHKIVAPLLAAVVLVACGSQGKSEVESFAEQSSYAIGVDIGRSLQRGQAEIRRLCRDCRMRCPNANY